MMDKTDKQEAYGVFKPVGHVVASFDAEAGARSAMTALAGAGFGDDRVVYYSPQQMKQQADIDIENAGILASLGQELNLVKAHRSLAEQGYSFLVIGAPDDDQARQVGEICAQHGANRAQKYGRFIIEELIEPGSGEKQVAESPDRGLDEQNRTGVEGAPPASR